MNYATEYDIGDRKRAADNGINEDSVAVTTLTDGHRASEPRAATVFVLADGAGGAAAGDVASYVATTVVASELAAAIGRLQLDRPGAFDIALEAEAPTDTTVETAIADAVAEAGRTLASRVDTADGQVATTLVVAVRLGARLHYGWLGDSRLYLYNRAHERLDQLTHDHAPVARQAATGELDAVEAQVHPDGNRIDRALVARPETDAATTAEHARADLETGTVPLYRDDRLLLTSDGLIDAQTDARELYREYVSSGRDAAVGQRVLEAVVTDSDIETVLRTADSVTAAAERLVALANDRGGKDNISVIVASGADLPRSPPASGGLPARGYAPARAVETRETCLRTDD